jgi:poly-beta-1,6-N-acetyl-D-glucosamine synthase
MANLLNGFLMIYAIFIFLSLYILALIALLIGFHRATSIPKATQRRQEEFISVVVPFRNEAWHLSRIVLDLQRQEYGSFEVILVNDQSTDDGVAVVLNLISNDKRFKLLESPGVGKKAALTYGIQEARGSVIATTDADCQLSTHWLNALNMAFRDDHIMLAFGPVALKDGKRFFEKLQGPEFATVIGTGIASAGLGVPLYCNGANLAFRKHAFHEVHGYEHNDHILSGDDEFLLKKIQQHFQDGVKYINDTDALVLTHPQTSVQSFVRQRLRWASKWRQTGDRYVAATALLVFAIQVSVIVTYLTLLTSAVPGLVYLIGAKVALEFIFIYQCSHYLNIKLRLFHFLLWQCVYPLYVIYVGIACNLVTVRWKGRTSGVSSPR